MGGVAGYVKGAVLFSDMEKADWITPIGLACYFIIYFNATLYPFVLSPVMVIKYDSPKLASHEIGSIYFVMSSGYRLHILCDVIWIYIFIIGSHIFRYDSKLHGQFKSISDIV